MTLTPPQHGWGVPGNPEVEGQRARRTKVDLWKAVLWGCGRMLARMAMAPLLSLSFADNP